MEKLEEYLQKWQNGEKVNEVGAMSLYDIDCVFDVYQCIMRKEEAEFINSKVKTVLELCEIPIKEKGTGWIVVL